MLNRSKEARIPFPERRLPPGHAALVTDAVPMPATQPGQRDFTFFLTQIGQILLVNGSSAAPQDLAAGTVKAKGFVEGKLGRPDLVIIADRNPNEEEVALAIFDDAAGDIIPTTIQTFPRTIFTDNGFDLEPATIEQVGSEGQGLVLNPPLSQILYKYLLEQGQSHATSEE